MCIKLIIFLNYNLKYFKTYKNACKYTYLYIVITYVSKNTSGDIFFSITNKNILFQICNEFKIFLN